MNKKGDMKEVKRELRREEKVRAEKPSARNIIMLHNITCSLQSNFAHVYVHVHLILSMYTQSQCTL